MMRTLKFLSLLLFLASCARQYIPQDTLTIEKHPVLKGRIIVDAGHGGKDPGAQSVKDFYEEKQLTLTTAKHVCNFLKELGYDASLTRNQDVFVPLQVRSEIANRLHADLFISIHYNYSPNVEARGIEVFYFKEQPASSRVQQSRLLAEDVLDRVINHTGAKSRGIKAANHAVTRETEMPAILIEGGFLSNALEREKLKDARYIRYLAWGIARGIDRFFDRQNVKKHPRRESNARPVA